MRDLDAVHRSASPATGRAFAEFCQLIRALREPGGCPWDAKQTHASIASNMTEEAAEAVDAILADDPVHLCEELGDVLLEVVLQAQIAEDAGEFTIDDVIAGIDDKIVRRHPHVFGAEVSLARAGFSPDEIAELESQGVSGPDAVGDLWERIKARERKLAAGKPDGGEGGDGPEPRGLLDDVPRSLPALMQAAKISKKAVGAGFEWESTEAVWDQVASEYAEFEEALAARDAGTEGGEGSVGGIGGADDGDSADDGNAARAAGAADGVRTPEAADAVAEEFGDILFSLVNVARREHIDPEGALLASCGKFRRRWAYMEASAARAGTTLDAMDRPALERLWCEAKAALAG